MSIYSPIQSGVEKLRLLFKRRVRDAELAYLGDSDLPGARVEIPDRKGYVYARFLLTGNTYTPPFPVRSMGAAYASYPGAPVYVAYGRSGELQIVEGHPQAFDRAGIDTRAFNPANQQSKWVYLWQLTIALCTAVGNSVTSSFLVSVKQFLHYTGNTFNTFETGSQADKIDLSSYVPATDMHCYAAVWIDLYANVAEVVTSTPQSLFTPLDMTDVQECVDNAPGRPPDAVALKLFYLANDQDKITQQPAKDIDPRQFLNMPQVWGFPTNLTTRERVRPGYTLVTAPYTTSGNGALTVESGGRVVIKPVDNLSATTDPTINDDSGDGYSIGSAWINTASDTVWFCTDATAGAAVWVDVSSGGSTPPFADTTAIVKGSADATKLLRFEVDGFTTATTRVLTPPNYDGTIATLAGTETFTNKTLTSPTVNTPTISGGTIDNTPIGATTPNTGYFSALRLIIGGFAGIFTHAITAARTWTFPDKDGTVAMTSDIALNAITGLTGDVTGTGPGSTATTLANSGVSAGDYPAPYASIDAKGRVTNAYAGLNWKSPVRQRTITALPACTYANGSSGVGATLTANANGALPSIDLVSMAVNDRLLVKSQSAGEQNGVYVVTDLGSAGTKWVLTRATDCDTAAKITQAMFFITSNTLAPDSFYVANTGAITMGSTSLSINPLFATARLRNLTATAVNANILPDTTSSSLELGSNPFYWNGFFGQFVGLKSISGTPTPGSTVDFIYNKSGLVTFNPAGGSEQVLSPVFAILTDSKTTGTQGGASSATTWNNRDLNTEQYDPVGIVSISSNKFTPVAGTYKLMAASAVVGGTGGSAARNRLFNVTGSTAVQQGLNVFVGASVGATAQLDCTFTANGTDQYRIDTYTSTAKTTNGLGNAVSDGSNEIYTVVVLQKIG